LIQKSQQAKEKASYIVILSGAQAESKDLFRATKSPFVDSSDTMQNILKKMETGVTFHSSYDIEG